MPPEAVSSASVAEITSILALANAAHNPDIKGKIFGD
jgi:hypothetical protein